MNREIKFRAWNGSKMRYKVSINDGKCVRYGYQWFNHENDIYKAEPMQFTGLKDKNGVEIYEGDIVKEYHGDVVVVEWLDEASCGCCNYGSGYYYSAIEAKRFEVIGNIYENPELLEN